MRFSHLALCLLTSPLLAAPPASPPNGDRVTILYDAFGARADLARDWGFAALVEYQGKRILFDTGNNAEIFARNVKRLGVDLSRLDFVVMSHRHGDHTAGLEYLLRVNPGVKIYAPKEGFGVFGATLPNQFYRRESTLPDSMKYFEGHPPEILTFGTPWVGANFTWIDTLTQVAPGIAIISTVSATPGTLELRELSLALKTAEGAVLLVGCSHPGIETILAATKPFGEQVRVIFGGLHLVTAPDSVITRIATALDQTWRVGRVAPGHCTGEPAFAALRRVFGRRYVFAGLGTVTDIS
jgi:7,8-dihydropterin-6-yl-methyl-4-(beta-D-ribofuranosyl)aminobenzene 5'-phosphate synthase